MQIKTQILKYKTDKSPQLVDITDDVKSFVEKTGIEEGLVNIYSQHTTAAIKINENEPLLNKDLTEFLKKMVQKNNYYFHNDFAIRTEHMRKGESKNAHSHCLHLLLPTLESRPIIQGKVNLGVWQRIFLIELDHDRERQVLVQVIGE